MEINKQNSKLSELMEDDNLRLQIEADSERLKKSISELNEVYREWQLVLIDNMINDCNGYFEAVDLLTKVKNNIISKNYYPIHKIQQYLLNEFHLEKISAYELNEELKDFNRFKQKMEAINGR